MKKIGFIGVGIMGKSMVRNLMKAGFELHIYARTRSKVEDVISEGAIFHETIADCVKDCDAVITIVGFPVDVEEVYFDKGNILDSAKEGAYLIDMTTTSPMLDQKIAEELETIIQSVDTVKTAKFQIVFDPTLVRGMSYYTGPIFEIAMDEYGGSVGGGGRYDEMIGKFTGNQTCACGFSIGFERIVMLLLERDYQVPSNAGKKAYLIEKNMPAEGMMKVLKQAEEDRKNGSVVTIAVMKKNKKFQKEKLAAEGYKDIVEFFNN